MKSDAELDDFSLVVPTEAISAHVKALSRIGNLGPNLSDGFTRPGWSTQESTAIRYIMSEAEAAGFTPDFDAVGNLFLSYHCTKDNQIVQIGSHLDTVVRGGLFDGGAGIIAGLEALKAVAKENRTLSRGLQLVIWRGEESGSFGVAFKGSKAAYGQLPASALARTHDGVTLAEAIRSAGFDPAAIEAGTPTIDSEFRDRIAAHFELHIEQGVKLSTEGDDLGIVTSIRGPRRLRLEVHGCAAHSGATPMGPRYRQDANLALAYLQVALDQQASAAILAGEDLVQTIGILNSDRDYNATHPKIYESGITKIAGYAYAVLDIRSNSASFLNRYTSEISNLCTEMSQTHNVRITLTELGGSEPLEQMNLELQEAMAQAAKQFGYRYQLMPCGAGHDVQIVASQRNSAGQNIPGALLLIPCHEGISHHPLEFTSDEMIARGARTLAAAIRTLTL